LRQSPRHTGDAQIEVLALCGEPSSIQARTLYKHRSLSQGTNVASKTQKNATEFTRKKLEIQMLEIEEWASSFGSNRLLKGSGFIKVPSLTLKNLAKDFCFSSR
jgi:hypothetical protein